jgi:hypothetical protein
VDQSPRLRTVGWGLDDRRAEARAMVRRLFGPGLRPLRGTATGLEAEGAFVHVCDVAILSALRRGRKTALRPGQSAAVQLRILASERVILSYFVRGERGVRFKDRRAFTDRELVTGEEAYRRRATVNSARADDYSLLRTMRRLGGLQPGQQTGDLLAAIGGRW